MRHFPFAFFRAGLLLCALFIASTALAQPVPTFAWRRFIANAVDDVPGGVETDLSGNGYFQYVVNTSGLISQHVVKMSPANNVIWDVNGDGTTFGNGFAPTGICMTPKVSGVQYLWATGNVQGLGSTFAWADCYPTAGGSKVASMAFSNPFGTVSILATQSDASGNLMVAANDTGTLRMITYDRALNTVSSNFNNSSIDPTMAFWNSSTNTWIAAGKDMSVGATANSAAWGSFNPTNGVAVNEYSSAGSASVFQNFVVSPLPNGAIGVIHNTLTGTTYTHEAQVRSAATALVWMYPATGTSAGVGFQMASLSASAPVYLVGGPDTSNSGNQSVDKFSGVGALQFHHTHQPVRTIYPTTEGFFGFEYYQPTNAIFIQHYIDATNTYDWGKAYNGTGSNPNLIGGLKMFQNFFYLMHGISNSSTGYDIQMERYTTGIALQSVTCASTVKQGTQLAVTIHLNGNVVGSPMTVALNSSNTKLRLPNGTQGQNFSIAVGQNQLVVNLSAQATSSNASSLLTAIQNGVRRTAVSTVIP